MDVLSDILSGLALVAIIIIGRYSIRLGQRSAKAAENSARASVQAAEATERSVSASERAAALAAQDARLRRLEAVLDVVLEQRELFNEQIARHEGEVPPWVPFRHSPDELARTALCRKLEARLVPFYGELGDRTMTRSLAMTHNWNSTFLEGAIEEVKDLIRATAEPAG